MIISVSATYYLIAGLAVVTLISGIYEFLVPNPPEMKAPVADSEHDEGTHQAAVLKNQY